MNAMLKRGAGLLASAMLLGLAGGGALAAPATQSVTPVRAGDLSKPAAVPGDYVVTPFGYFHPSCVQALDSSEQLLEDGSVRLANGGSRSVAACQYPAYLRNGTRIAANDVANRALRAPTTYNGYLQLVSTVLANGADQLSATMTVPPAPTNQAGQTLYFFPGLEDYENVVSILQPVLGWNGFGDNAWTITSWNCCKAGTVYHGNNVTVAPGDVILGTMVNTGGQDWTITARDQTNPSLRMALLRTQGYHQSFDWIFAGALETYGVSTCDQFPSSGPITFGSIATDVNGTAVRNPAWSVQSASGSPATCTGATIVNSTTVTVSY